MTFLSSSLRRRPFTVAAVSTLLLASSSLAETVILSGGTIHTMAGEEPFVGTVVIDDGRITSVRRDDATEEVAVDSQTQLIRVPGLDIYPGFFDGMSSVGLVEISSIAATVDTTERPAYLPHLQAATAIHPASEVIPVSRSAGVTNTLVAPQAGTDGVVPGQASAVHLDGWTVEEMLVDRQAPGTAMVIDWPEIRTRSFDFTTFTLKERSYTEAKKEAEEKIGELRDWFEAARHYQQAVDAGSGRAERDLKLEALARTLDGGQKVVMAAQSQVDLEAALDFAAEFDLDVVLAGGRDAWKIKERLAEEQVPVILGMVAALPANDDDPYDRAFQTAGELRAAGVEIAFGSGTPGGGFGPSGPHFARSLPFEVGMATAYGLEHEDALDALTAAAARILGLEEHLGTIEPGKIGNLLVVEGDPLDLNSRVEHLLIGGRIVDLTDRHQQLYERYRARPLPGD